MFNECYKLKVIKGIEKFNTINVENMSAMFQNCNEIQSLNLSSFDTTKVKDISSMFNNCHKLKYLNFSKLKILSKCKTKNIFSFSNKCKIIADDSILNKLYKNLHK